jgi:tryptophan-rich sensory protein
MSVALEARKFVLALVPLIGGILSGLLRASDTKKWYGGLKKAPWNPPSWVFGPVWTLLYLSIGISYHLVTNSPSFPKPPDQARTIQTIYWIQLVLNFLWSPLFFGLKAPSAAFVDIILLWVYIYWMRNACRNISPVTGHLLLPYLAWVSYAATLNAYIVVMNE